MQTTCKNLQECCNVDKLLGLPGSCLQSSLFRVKRLFFIFMSRLSWWNPPGFLIASLCSRSSSFVLCFPLNLSFTPLHHLIHFRLPSLFIPLFISLSSVDAPSRPPHLTGRTTLCFTSSSQFPLLTLKCLLLLLYLHLFSIFLAC